MKAKHQREWLQMKINWRNKLSPAMQKATIRPGSVKTR